jgi:crotonobetainyl-CoA:carnitine CoA-transferase CaiB-like acyl-CoA transferase
MQLGDGGADVIKVEPIGGDWARSLGVKIKGESALFLALNRNKKSIAVDVTKEKGKEIVHRLAKESDVLLEELGPRKAEELGLGYDEMRRVNPKLIYCSMSAFGSSGPYKDRPASELEIQGMSAYQWFLGEPGGAPVRVGADVVQVTTGIWAFIGILTGLHYRRKAGIGQKLEISMLHGLIMAGSYFFMAHYNPDYWGGWFITGPYGPAERGYQTGDRPILFGMPLVPDKMGKAWEVFLPQIGLAELLNDPYFRENGMRLVGIGRDAQEMKPLFETHLMSKTSEELKEIVEGVGGYCGIFKTYDQIFKEGQVDADQMVLEIDHPVAGKIRTTGFPWKLLKTPAKIRLAPPALGQHTDEILTGLGYPKEEITALRQAKVVA